MLERAIEKVGGAFKLTVLVQRRVREIVRGASPLVPVTPDMSPIDIALKEILEDKVGYGGEMLPPDKGSKEAAEAAAAAAAEKAEGKAETEKKAKSKAAKKKKDQNGAGKDE